MIYLDNASTTKIDARVLEAMMPYLTESYGNAGTLYSIGKNAAQAIAKARRQVAELIGAMPEQIVFTSGGSEANNMVFAGLRDYMSRSDKCHIVASQIEHDSVLKAIKNLTQNNFDATFVAPCCDGVVHPRTVLDSITRETGIVSVMHTNNETGVENPVNEIASICRENGILFHTDCVQAVGCQKIDVGKIDCDFLSLSAHKVHAPKGVGALYVKDTSKLSPLIFGGASQEFGLRGGTENVAGIVGFGEACKILKNQLHEDETKIMILKQRLYNDIKKGLERHGLSDIMHLNGSSPIQKGKVLNLRFDNVDGETLLLLLDAKGVCVSAGSACRSHESEPSHVLVAMGIDEEDARNSIRLSLSRMNTDEEVAQASEIIVNCVVALR